MNSINLAGRSNDHLDHLDGWRGLAIATLLVGHFFPLPGINLGTVGVNMFFVLSGLLMGGLLFEKNEQISRFYRRRVARIVPAHVVFILLIVVYYALSGKSMDGAEVISALLFLNNYIEPAGGPGTALMPFGHIWSLSVEEHSYIALSLVAIGSRRGYFSSAAGVGALLFCSMAFALYYQWLNPPDLAFSEWLHTEVAAFGILAAAIWAALGRPWPSGVTLSWLCPALLVLGVLAHWWSVPLAIQRLVGVGCFVLAICSLSVARGWFARVLSIRPLRQLGVWSYSLYLWQQPFYLWMHSDESVSAVEALALAMVCGLISYYFVERPARSVLNSHWQPNPAKPG